MNHGNSVRNPLPPKKTLFIFKERIYLKPLEEVLRLKGITLFPYGDLKPLSYLTLHKLSIQDPVLLQKVHSWGSYLLKLT